MNRSFSVAAAIPMSAILKYECFPDFCREGVTLLGGDGAGRVIKVGSIIGLRTIEAGDDVEAEAGENTGNGVLTLADPPVGDGVKAGDYVLTVTGGTFDGSIAAAAGNTGNGTAAMNATETANGVVVGVYKAICIEPATDLGRFEVFGPDGVSVGTAIVGTLFDGVVKFTVSDGGTDFVAGDEFDITVIAAVPANGLGTFSIVDPDGVAQESGVIGTAYNHELKFTLADGGTNFIVGDSFTITVPAGDSKAVEWDPDADDGSAEAYAVSLANVTAPDGVDGSLLVLARGPAIINADAIQWPAETSADEKAEVLAALAAKQIIARYS